MTTLIRSASHGNAVRVIYLSSLDVFRKVSQTAFGQKYLESEIEGIHWYTQRLAKPSSQFIKQYWKHGSYSRIDLFRIPGKQLREGASLATNGRYLELCIDHYVKFWPKDEIVPCHGDLTLYNVIFSEDSPVFFDWEHFYQPGEQWGFDICYLIISAAVLPYVRSEILPPRERSILRRLWGRLHNYGLQGYLAEQPMNYFQEKFTKTKHWTEIVERSPRKFFPMWSTEAFNEHLHAIINE